MHISKLLKKVASYISLFSVILNIFQPILLMPALLFAPSPVAAQELVASPTPADSVAPTPTDAALPSPTVVASPTVAPVDSPTPTPTIAPSSPLPTTDSSPAPPVSSPTSTPTPTPSPTATPTPSVTPTPVVSPTPAPTTSATLLISSPVLTTDKLDYNPTETVKVSGTGLMPVTVYTLEIVSSDPPAVDFIAPVSTNTTGAFTYAYTLDGTYRPNYTVYLKDVAGATVATTTFTDANPSANLDQCANGQAPSPSTDGCNADSADWVNGNLGESKSVYYEGDSIPYRLRFDNLSLASHTVIIEWDTTKSDKHALDYLTSFNRTVANANPCLGVSGCGSPTTFAIPSDPQVTGSGVTPVAGNFTMYGGTITSVSSYSYADGTGFSGDKSARIAITFTAGQANPTLAWGSHISTRSDWGLSGAATAIPGSPYHTRLINLDGSGGNQDRSLSAAAVIFPGSVTVIKQATPEGATSFAFTASPAPLANFSLIDDGTSSNTHVFGNITNFQTYTVNETPIPAGWAFDSAVCNVTSANGGSSSISSTTATINMKEGENYTCTYTNHLLAGTLIVRKHVVNDDGGSLTASDFTMHVKAAGSDVTGSPSAGSESGTSYSLAQGSYVVSENNPPSGYTMTGISGDCDANGNVSVVAGQTKTCTVTNNDVAAHLVVIKHVVNDDGGSAVASDFTMAINSVTAVGGNSFPGAENPGTSKTLSSVGSYSVSESGPAGYAASYSADCSGTISLGQTKTCTVTNDDQGASLTVIKHVINNNGGTAVAADFTMSVTGSSPSPSSFPGAENPGTNVAIHPGSYSVGESSVTGYTGSYSADCTGTIALGQHKTCTVTNDDVAPHLIVIKHVINDNGGTAVASDFTLDAGGTNDSPDNFAGHESPGTDVTLDAGSYNVSESGPAGYAANYSADCSGTIAVGVTKTCTVTNDDMGATLVVIKHVINDNGGTAVAGDFTMAVNGNSPVPSSFAGVESPGTNVAISAGAYSVGESGPSGYTASYSADCTGSIALGQTKTCTVTNNDQPAHLIVIKHVVNDNGGNNVAGDFTMNVTAVNPSSASFAGVENPGTNVTVDAGAYSVGESGPGGYTASYDNCIGSIGVGETKTCTVTNDDQPAHIVLTKVVINNNGGTAGPNQFGLSVDASPVISGSTTDVTSNTAHALNEAGLAGYQFVSLTGDAKCPAVLGGSVTLNEGETVHCTITNDDLPGHLVIVKNTVGGDGTFTFNVTGPTAGTPSLTTVGGTATTGSVAVDAGAYAVGENVPAGWDLTGAVCSTGTPASFTVALDSTVTCTFTNTKRGTVTIVKDAVPNDLEDFRFTGTLGSAFYLDDDAGVQGIGDNGDIDRPQSQLFNSVVPGTQTVAETSPNQYWALQGVACVDNDTLTAVTAPVLNGGVTFTLNPGQNITCTFTNNKVGLTRTQGFWKTHTSFTTTIFQNYLGSSITIGTGLHTKVIDNTAKLFAAYYADISKMSNGKKRTALDQARMTLLRQLLTAKLNCAAFGCASSVTAMIAGADAAYAGTDRNLILSYAGQLDAYNNSGDTIVITPPLPVPGRATPSVSQTTASSALYFWDTP